MADHYKLTTISVGDLLKKEVSKKQELGEEIESYFKHFTLVKDEIVTRVVRREIEGIQKERKSFILSGYPHIDEAEHFGSRVMPHLKTCSLPHAYARVPSETPATPLGTGPRR